MPASSSGCSRNPPSRRMASAILPLT
jgi:hypothetical protein